jgi:nitroreductase
MATATTLSPHDLIERLTWRYAVKSFDPDRRIPHDDWAQLERALVLSPSSYGLQPWRFLVISDEAVRRELLTVSMGQTKVVDASHLVVFAARTAITVEDVRRWTERIGEVRKTPRSQLDKLQATIVGDLVEGPRAKQAAEWAKRQVYLALGVFVTSAAAIGIDVCPMEGFDPAGYDRILKLPEKGYTATVIATAGYRNPTDREAGAPKVRFPDDEVVEEV